MTPCPQVRGSSLAYSVEIFFFASFGMGFRHRSGVQASPTTYCLSSFSCLLFCMGFNVTFSFPFSFPRLIFSFCSYLELSFLPPGIFCCVPVLLFSLFVHRAVRGSSLAYCRVSFSFFLPGPHHAHPTWQHKASSAEVRTPTPNTSASEGRRKRSRPRSPMLREVVKRWKSQHDRPCLLRVSTAAAVSATTNYLLLLVRV